MNAKRQTRRMRQALLQAFRELLHEKTYAAITIGDIAERADVGRSTFYRYFADKQAILVALHADIYRDWQLVPTTQAGWLQDTPAPKLVALLERVDSYDNQAGLVNMFGKEVGQLMRQIEDVMRHEVYEGLQAAFPEVKTAVPLSLLAAQIAGILDGTLKWWYFERPAMAAEEAAAHLQRMMKTAVVATLELDSTAPAETTSSSSAASLGRHLN